MLSTLYFLCLIPFDQPGLFYPWFECVRLVPKCSRFTAPLTQRFAFTSLPRDRLQLYSPFCTGDGYELHCTKNRARETEFVTEGRARWKTKKAQKPQSKAAKQSPFARHLQTRLLQFKPEACAECYHAFTGPYTTCKKNL